MWRLPGLPGRALARLLIPGLRGVNPKSTTPSGPQVTSSTLVVPVPTFDRSGPHGPGPGTSRGPRSQRWKDAFQWVSARVSPNTLWDAISWGTLAVLALQLARQIHFQASLPAGPRRAEHCSWHSPLDRFLSSPWWLSQPSLRRHILPRPEDSPAPRHPGLREPRLSQEEPCPPRESPSSHSSLTAAGLQDPSEEGLSDIGLLNASSNFKGQAKPTEPQPTGEKQEQDKSNTLSLEEAVTSIQQLFQLSVSIAFNFLGEGTISGKMPQWCWGPMLPHSAILKTGFHLMVQFDYSSFWPPIHIITGTENMKNEDHAAAFSYFQKAADRGYSKAQYNVGLCHEHGRGTPRDLGKAVLSYRLAANQGHSLAQYRYARCLLQEPASSWDPERLRAVSLLRQAADSGLREAQAFLGVLFTKEPHLDEQGAVKYLWLAASNGDSQSMYHLGICHEKGLGVQRSLGEAVRCYRKSAALGNQPARERLRTLFSMEAAAPGPSNSAVTGLKSFSSPSLCSLNTLLAGASHLPHASSTGSLGLLCRSGHLGSSRGTPSRAIAPHPYPLERSLVRLGFG